MKKIIFIVCLLILSTVGCGKISDEKIKNDFIDKVNNMKSYNMKGELKLSNNDDVYKYDVEVSYKNNDYYNVSLTNKNNGYKQVILKNDEGVYVITPELNKSFRFQSDWPYNNSQVYILKSIVKDFENTKDYTYKKENDNHIFNIDANYPNNPKLKTQNIILDKNNELKKVEVLDDNGIALIEFKVTSIDNNPKFSKKEFIVENQISNEDLDKKEETSETMSIDDALFPLYIPENTSMTNKEVITTDVGERVIMTFSGEKPFILVEENVVKEDELTIVPTYGEPYLLVDTVGSLTDMSYTWTSNGIEYYIVSDVMNQNELLQVASSIGIVSTLSEK